MPFSSDIPLKVSIVIPVYNGENYLSGAIESALSQTYKNIEIIVVNDGSDDEGATRTICNQYAGKIIYVEQDNEGVASALNTALRYATGQYFCWLSHDDEFLPEKTQKQINFFNQLKRKDLVLFSNYYLMDSDGRNWHESNLDINQLRQTPSIALLRGMVNGCSLMIPMEVLRKHLPFKTSLRFTQDYEMWDRLRKDAEFILIPETLIRYRIHEKQDTDATNPEFVIENDNLWIKMMSGRSDTEKVLLNGSRKKYYSELYNFLSQTAYKGAKNMALNQSVVDLEDILVSIIIPFFNGIEMLEKAIKSALSQTHRKLDIVLVNDGSTQDISSLKALIANDNRLRLFNIQNGGPGHARNLGLQEAKGEYIAFLDSDDEFMPEKIRRQLSLMMDKGYIFSHTSYTAVYPEGRIGEGLIDSGKLTGNTYPDIISSCPIATPTVMIHKVALLLGLKFPTDSPLTEDVQTWIWLAQRAPLLGISESLSKITWRNDSAALNITKSIKGFSLLRKKLQNHPVHKLQLGALAELERTHKALEDMYDFAASNSDTNNANNIVSLDTIRLAFKDESVKAQNITLIEFILEVGHKVHCGSEKSYTIHKRSI